jgi:ABC-type molybdenum transport system ATPase subunit/photorepair protein PhrA
MLRLNCVCNVITSIALCYNVCDSRAQQHFRKNDAIPANFEAKPLVSLSNVGVRRNGRWLVRGVDFSVSRGEIVTLIGPNGSGKSTTVKTAIGVMKPDEGKVTAMPA